MADEATDPKKKIIIDEDWKSQVEAEKQAARAAETKRPAAAAPPLPTPDLIFLASSIYLQAMVALGLLPNPMAENKRVVQLDQAKHAIDTLEVLFDKTEGNRTADETAAIDDMLHQLRMAYIAMQPTRGHGEPEASPGESEA
jgi:hypothetical protein